MTAVTRKADQGTAVVPIKAAPLDLDANDISLPTIKLGQHMSGAVQDRLVNFGDIYSSVSADDGDPVVIGGIDKPGIRFHVLSVERSLVRFVDGKPEFFDYNDPDAPDDAWKSYKYLLCLPAVDSEIPYKLILTRTSAPAAKQLNLHLKRHELNGGQPWDLAFTLHAVGRENAKGKFGIFQVRQSIPVTDKERQAHEADTLTAVNLVGVMGSTSGRSTEVSGPEI